MIKIAKFEIENVKRVKAVKIEPTSSGLTVIGGRNEQGKTSILDGIAWALGGNKHKPSQAEREGSNVAPVLKLTLSNGFIVERKGKNSDLKVTDPNGVKSGQQLLDSFVEELAIDLPKFMNSSNKEKANILLRIIGVGQQLATLEIQEQEIYNQRRAIGQIAEQKEKFAKEQFFYQDVPKELISASELIQQQQGIMARNGENQRKRHMLTEIERKYEWQRQECARMEEQLNNARITMNQLSEDLAQARKTALDLMDESTAELENNINEIDQINYKIRANMDKDKAEMDAADYRQQREVLSNQIDAIRQQKTELLNSADLPLPGLSVVNGELVYNGQQWDNMSGSGQLKVATAIVRKLKPDCGFILLDKLEQMDLQTLHEFGAWLEEEGLQAIATRVSTGEECSIIIQDGYVVGQENIPMQQPQTPVDNVQGWKAGEF